MRIVLEKIGNWRGATRMLRGVGGKFEEEIDEATKKNLAILLTGIERAFAAEGPGWAAIKSKSHKRKKEATGRTKILQFTGAMFRAIRKQQKSWREGFVGGARMVGGHNLLAIHDEGRGTQPKRPIFDPVLRKYEGKVIKNYEEAIERALK